MTDNEYRKARDEYLARSRRYARTTTCVVFWLVGALVCVAAISISRMFW